MSRTALDVVERFGPQRATDTRLLRRIRAHQSWYRADVLRLSAWGATPAPLRTPLGSILTASDAAAGHNFDSVDAADVYRARRTQGWGMDPIRCQSYMTSSQALTLNLFGPLLADHGWLLEVLRRTADVEWPHLQRTGVEFAPNDRIHRMGDRTIADAFFASDSGGRANAVVVETKFADRFSVRYLDLSTSPHHVELNARLNLWRVDSSEFGGRATNQLARVHALGSTYAAQPAILLLIHHPLDTVTPAVAERYRSTLQDPTLLKVIDLGVFLHTMASSSRHPHQRALLERMHLRYLDLQRSEPLWSALQQRS